VKLFVLFVSSFRRPGAMNISHETVDRVKTLCGRRINKNAQVEPDDRDNWEPDCITCRKAKKARDVT